jgi:hypothetical protein
MKTGGFPSYLPYTLSFYRLEIQVDRENWEFKSILYKIWNVTNLKKVVSVMI